MESKKPEFTARELFDIKDEKIRANQADFRKKMKKTSKDAKLLYRICCQDINRYKAQLTIGVVIKVGTENFEVACEAASLLSHRSKGYEASVQVDCRSGYSTAFSVVITRSGAIED